MPTRAEMDCGLLRTAPPKIFALLEPSRAVLIVERTSTSDMLSHSLRFFEPSVGQITPNRKSTILKRSVFMRWTADKAGLKPMMVLAVPASQVSR